jgi:hypothetical protein
MRGVGDIYTARVCRKYTFNIIISIPWGSIYQTPYSVRKKYYCTVLYTVNTYIYALNKRGRDQGWGKGFSCMKGERNKGEERGQ